MRCFKTLVGLLLCIFLACCMTGCRKEADGTFGETEDFVRVDHAPTLADFSEAKIGILTGSSQELIIKERFPNAERVYFSTIADMILAVEQGKIDCYSYGSPFLTATIWENAKVKRIDEAISQGDIAFAFSQEAENPLLREQFNAFLADAKADGTLGQTIDKWLGDAEPTEHPDYESLSGENGIIRVAASAENKPLIYKHKNQCTGLEMELLTLFAEQYGYRLKVEVVPFASVIAGLSTGKYDMAAASLQITEERKESVLFSDPYLRFDVVLVVKADTASSSKAEESLADYADAKIGIITGSAHTTTLDEYFPNAERMYYTSNADLVIAVEQGKVDCYIEDYPFIQAAIWENADVRALDEIITTKSNGIIFPKTEEGKQLREQVNAFIAEAKADGTIDWIIEKWLGETEPTEHPDYMSLSGENGTIRLALAVDGKPMIYRYKEQCTGLEVELVTRFAEAYGYALEIEEIPFDSILAGVKLAKYDMAIGALTITPERAESVDFSDPYAAFDVVLAVRDDDGADPTTEKTLDDFAHAKIGVMVGTVQDDQAKERFPEAERHYFKIVPDMILAVEQGKIDGYLCEVPYATAALWEGANIMPLKEKIAETHAGYIFQKDAGMTELREQLNDFIRKSKESGLLDELQEKWFDDTEPTDPLSASSLRGENGTLQVAVVPDLKPLTYMKDGQLAGYEIDILVLFAEEYGYQLEFSAMTFDALLPGVTVGKYDIGAAGVTITEERQQSVDFTESHLTVEVALVVQADDGAAAEQLGFFDEVREGFEKTFVREDRWKLIVQGVGITMLISLCAAVAGTLLGFGLYMLSRSDVQTLRRAVLAFTKVYSRIVAGTPVVVILMILFYVVFGSMKDISGVPVAIIGFSLTFGAFVYEHMTVSVGSVDLGQTEAAYALGYPKNKTFFRVIFPQAMTIFLPSYCGQTVELIKATAVVGYIAVNDLTKMGDIIRSNTYEAFFPLIATALIYFVLTWLLSLLLNFVKIHFEPKRRSAEDILKGVKTI